MNLKNNKGITLIALVITIIVLLILAGVSISMISGDDGIATQASNASEKTRAGEINDKIGLTISENQMAKYSNSEETTRESVISELHQNGKLTDSEVEALKTQTKITIGGVEVDFSKLPGLNQYGFYFDKEYICNNWQGIYTIQDVKVTITENNGIKIHAISHDSWDEGITLRMYDFGGTLFATASPLEYNKVYTGTGTLNADCTFIVNDSGVSINNYTINQNQIEFIQDGINLGNGAITLEFSNNGNSFSFNGQVFSIEN